MPENENNETTEVTETETPALEAAATETETNAEKAAIDDLPEWAKKEIRSLRKESATHRTKLRDAEGALAAAITPEQYAEAHSQIAELKNRALRAEVLRQYDVPEALQQFLTATDEDALVEQAKALATAPKAPPAPEALKGGLSPASSGKGTDDIAGAVSAALSRRRLF